MISPETEKEFQEKYNEAHGITPQTIRKAVRDLISISKKVAAEDELSFENEAKQMEFVFETLYNQKRDICYG